MDRVRLDCMLDVIKEREQGKIGKTNILKMDSKVNRAIRKILDKDVPLYEVTLPEKVKNSKGQLPRPTGYDVRPIGPSSKEPNDFAHWKSLPKDVKKHEVKRMHCFLFNTTQKFELANETFLPGQFFPEVKK